MKILSRLLVFLLTFQLSFGSSWYLPKAVAAESNASHPNFTGKIESGKDMQFDRGVMESLDRITSELIQNTKEDRSYQEELSRLQSILDQKDITRAPRYHDAFLLGHQAVLETSGREFALTDVTQRSSVPLVPVAFKGDVALVSDLEAKEFKIQFLKNDKVAVEHVFKNRQVIAHYEDASHIYTLEKSGELYAAPKKVVYEAAFKAPVPWVKVAKLNRSVMSSIRANNNVVSMFGATAGMRSIESFHAEGVFPLDKEGKVSQEWKAGDLILRIQDANGKRQALGIYSFESIRANAAMGLSVLGREMDLLLENADILKGRKPGDLSKEHSSVKSRLNINKDLLQSSRSVLDSVLIEAYNSDFLSKNAPQRHSIVNSQLESDYAALVKNAKIENKSEAALEEEIRNNWDKYVLKDSEVKRSFWSKYGTYLMVMGGMATYVGLDYSFYLLRYGELPIAMVNAVSFLYELAGHHMLDADYRWVNFGSMAFLASLVPLVYYTGKALGKRIGKDAPAAILHYSLKLWALVIYPFYRALAKAAGQPLFLDAMKAGLNPFSKIKANSEVGKKLGLTKDTRIAAGVPVYRDLENNERLERQKKIVSELTQADIRKQSLAFVLGVGVTAKKHGIDLDVLYKAIQQRKSLDLAFMNVGKDYLNKEKILRQAHADVPNVRQKKILDSIDYLKEVDLATKDIFIELLKIKEAGLSSLGEIDKAEVAKYFAMAEKTVKELGATKLKRKARQLAFDTKNFLQRSHVGSSGEGSAYEFFWNVEPSRGIVEEYWQGFKSDYLFSSVQMGLIAARSWMHNPIALAADPASVVMAYRPHAAGMAEQVAIHMLPAAADKAYTFAAKDITRYESPVLEDSRYQPSEYVSLRGENAEESFWRSTINVVKKASNLLEANYPMVFLRSQYNAFRTIRAGMMIGLPTLMAAGLNFGSAVASYLYIKSGAIWAFTAYWYVEGHSVISHKEQLKEYNEALLRAKADISQGLRENSLEKVDKGYLEMRRIYQENHAAFKAKNYSLAANKARELQKELKLSNAQMRELKKEVLNHYALIAQISNAIEANDKEAIEKAELKLRHFADYPERFKDGRWENMAEAKELLKYSLRHPPVKASMNVNAHTAFLLIGAVLTTYLATGFFADAVDLETNKWKLLLEGLSITAAFYAVIFGIQFSLKALKAAWDSGSSIKLKETSYVNKLLRKVSPKKISSEKPTSCRFSFSKANRGN